MYADRPRTGLLPNSGHQGPNFLYLFEPTTVLPIVVVRYLYYCEGHGPSPSPYSVAHIRRTRSDVSSLKTYCAPSNAFFLIDFSQPAPRVAIFIFFSELPCCLPLLMLIVLDT